MAAMQERQRGSRIYVWIVGGLAIALVLFAGYSYFFSDRFIADPDLLDELQPAPLPPQGTHDSKPGEWPRWRGPNRDGVSQETGWLTQWPKQGPPRLWKRPAGAGYSAVAVSDGRVYTMLRDDDQETVVCWNAATGKQKWRQSYAAPVESDRKFDTGYGGGPRSTPTVEGKFVYTVGATGLVHCWDAASGTPVWERDLFTDCHAQQLRWGISFSPLIQGKLIFTNPGGSDGHSLVALDKRTGRVVWHKLDDPAGYSSPMPMTVAGIDQVIFFTGKGLVSAAPKTGEVFWTYPWETNYGCNIATPIVVGAYVFISTGYDHGCALLKVSKAGLGKLKVQRVYETNRMCNKFSTSVFYQDHLYGFNENLLTCMNFRTGKVVWKQKGFRKGSLMIADGYLIVLGERGQLAVARANPEAYQELSRFTVSRNQTWTVPVLAGGKLFVRDETDLYCFDVKKH